MSQDSLVEESKGSREEKSVITEGGQGTTRFVKESAGKFIYKYIPPQSAFYNFR